MLETDIAYCAGLVDGEGCIRIAKSKPYKCQGRTTPAYHAKLQVKMVDESAIQFLTQTLGGTYYRTDSTLRSGRPFYVWQISDMKAESACRTIIKFLRVKREQAMIVLALRELQRDNSKYRTKIVGYRNFPNSHGTPRQVPNLAFADEYVAECERLFLACKKLNRVGIAALSE